MTLPEKIKLIMATATYQGARIDQTTLAKIAGVTKSAVGRWLKEEVNPKIAHEHARSIEAKLGFSADWLAYGEGPMRRNYVASAAMQRVLERLVEIDRLDGVDREDALYMLEKLLPTWEKKDTG